MFYRLLLFAFLLKSPALTACAFHAAGPVKVIITGHTGGGKTSVINELAKRGYQVVPECATIVVNSEYALLDKLHPEKAPHNSPSQIENLQFKIFDTQEIAYNQALVQSIMKPPKNNLIIFDRSEFDTWIYCQIFYPPNFFTASQQEFFSKIVKRALDHHHFNQNVLFFNARHEESLSLGNQIHKYYQDFGFILHEVGFKDTVAEKADYVEGLLLKLL